MHTARARLVNYSRPIKHSFNQKKCISRTRNTTNAYGVAMNGASVVSTSDICTAAMIVFYSRKLECNAAVD
jgi:hypothetical protein